MILPKKYLGAEELAKLEAGDAADDAEPPSRGSKGVLPPSVFSSLFLLFSFSFKFNLFLNQLNFEIYKKI